VSKKWDIRFLALAEHVAQWSKDPSTKCGAVITIGKKIISLGYNGFPTEIQDKEYLYERREDKYPRVIHAEVNAVLYAGGRQQDATLYTYPIIPCSECSKFIIQAGLARCVSFEPFRGDGEDLAERANLKLSRELFEEAEIEITLYTEKEHAKREDGRPRGLREDYSGREHRLWEDYATAYSTG